MVSFSNKVTLLISANFLITAFIKGTAEESLFLVRIFHIITAAETETQFTETEHLSRLGLNIMDNGSAVEDAKQLKFENGRLKKALKELTVEKNMMELRLFRAFNKLLATKKRKIKRLERTLRKLKKGNDGVLSDEEYHCDTCRCKNKRQIMRQRVVREVDENDDSDVTIDPAISDYGSETEIDEDIPSSRSDNTKTNPSSSVNISAKGDAQEGKSGVPGNLKAVETVDETSAQPAQGQEIPESRSDENKTSDPNSDYEMDDLVDELCS